MDPMELGKVVWAFIQDQSDVLVVTGSGLGGMKKLLERRRRRMQFRAIFGVPWPKNAAQRNATASAVRQIYLLLQAQQHAAQVYLYHFALLRERGMGPTIRSFQKQLTDIVALGTRAATLLSKAGYPLPD